MIDTGAIRRHIAIVDGAGGSKAMIVGHRVRIEDVVVWHERLGLLTDARNPARDLAR